MHLSEFREELKVSRLSTSGLNIKNWLTDVSTAELTKTGNKFQGSTLPTEAVIATKVMLDQASERNILDVEQEVRRLHEIIKQNLKSDRLELYIPPEGSPAGSFVAIKLIGEHYGKEEAVANQVYNSSTPIDITARGGFIRIIF